MNWNALWGWLHRISHGKFMLKFNLNGFHVAFENIVIVNENLGWHKLQFMNISIYTRIIDKWF